ncbi:hypothetical protein AAG906_015744 [Vitis piasezkii]
MHYTNNRGYIKGDITKHISPNFFYTHELRIVKTVISKAKHIAEEAITNLYCSILPQCLGIAELGCSSGPNALFVALELVITTYKVYQKLGRQLHEIQVFLNDLPRNDFNTLFKTVTKFQQNLSQEMGNGVRPCFFMGVLGSFYYKHFLSRRIEDNKGTIFMSSSSPPSALKAYYAQFQKDFSVFLKHRSEEIVEGGRMVPTSKERCYNWELSALALRDMVSEGAHRRRKLDSFNIRHLLRTGMKLEIEEEGSFVIDRLEVFEVDWDYYESGGPCNAAKGIRAVAKSMFAAHFGSGIVEEKPQYVNLVVSMTVSG